MGAAFAAGATKHASNRREKRVRPEMLPFENIVSSTIVWFVFAWPEIQLLKMNCALADRMEFIASRILPSLFSWVADQLQGSAFLLAEVRRRDGAHIAHACSSTHAALVSH
jgi:hypothetical protein